MRGDPAVHLEEVAHGDQRRGDADEFGDGAIDVVAEGEARGAAVSEAIAAEGAAPAAEDRADGDDLAERQVDTSAAFCDLAAEFVAGDDAGGGLLLAEVDANVAVAEAGRVDLEDNLARSRVGLWDIDDANASGFEEAQCFHDWLL